MRNAGYVQFSRWGARALIIGLLAWAWLQAGPEIRQPSEAMAADTDASVPVNLYFADAGDSGLRAERVSIQTGPNVSATGRAILEGLLKGPGSPDLRPTIPPGVRINGVFVTADKTAIVDLSPEAKERHPGGVRAAEMTVFSIVNSLVLNISKIERVKITIGGRERETLAGHIDLAHPYTANILLIR